MKPRAQNPFVISGNRLIINFLMNRSAIALSLFITANLSMTVQAQPEANSIDFKNCVLSTPGSPATARADCGFIEVSEDPDDPNGKKIPIHIAVAPSTATQPEPDPVFFLLVDRAGLIRDLGHDPGHTQ